MTTPKPAESRARCWLVALALPAFLVVVNVLVLILVLPGVVPSLSAGADEPRQWINDICDFMLAAFSS